MGRKLIKLKAKKISRTKTASVGYFKDVYTEDDMKSNAVMVWEMLKLPKYDSIKRQLRDAQGVINFVIEGAYAPLAEFLLKEVFSPNSNDVYPMGNDFTIPDDYIVSAKSLFGQDKSVGNNLSASDKLENFLFGTPKKRTTQWLKDNNLTEEDLKSLYGEESGSIMVEGIKEYTDKLRNLRNSRMYKEVIADYERIITNEENKRYNAQSSSDVPKKPVFSEEEYALLKKRFRTKRGLLKDTLNALDASFPILNITDSFDGSPERNDDGFISWSPTDIVNMAHKELVDAYTNYVNNENSSSAAAQSKAEDEFIKAVLNLLAKLKGYLTYDQSLNVVRSRLINFFNIDSDQLYAKFKTYYGVYSKLMSEFLHIGNKHGRIIMMTDVEHSALTSNPTSRDGNYYWQGGGVLAAFQKHNDAASERNVSKNRNVFSKRAIIIISQRRIDNLPNPTVIEMKVSPVDLQEAEIIVRNCLRPYSSEATRLTQVKGLADIQQRYGDKDPKQLKKEMVNYIKSIRAMDDQLGTIPQSSKRKMQTMIVGLGQAEAIRNIKEAIKSNAIYTYSEEGAVDGLSLDGGNIVKLLTDSYNKSLEEKTPGISVGKVKVKWHTYEYDRDPSFANAWGRRVKAHWQRKVHGDWLNKQIKKREGRIKEIDAILAEGKLTDELREKYLQRREAIQHQITKYQADLENLLKDLPHFTILYGNPGVGKSAWPQALADLLELTYITVDLGAIRDKWVGGTEEKTRRLMEMIFAAKDCVFLLDEIDKMLQMTEGSTGSSTAHETTQGIVANFLQKFQDDVAQLRENNTFVVATTNDLRGINTALVKRTMGSSYEVRSAVTPESLQRYLWNFLESEKQDDPDHPLINDGTTNEEKWDNTFKFIRSLDLKKIAEQLAGKGLPFRVITAMMYDACEEHNTYILSRQRYEMGMSDTIAGMPLTTNNMIEAAKLAIDDPDDNSKQSTGISPVASRIENVTEKLFKTHQAKIEIVDDPVTGEKIKIYKVPEVIEEVFSKGVPSEEEEPEQYEVVEEDIPDPNDPSKTRKQINLQKGKSMQELMDSGMQELPMPEKPEKKAPEIPFPQGESVEQEKEGLKPRNEEEIDADTIKSSTDYYYQFLVKSNIVKGNKLVQSQNIIKDTDPSIENKYFDECEKYGVYYFNDGQLLMAPDSLETQPQRPNGI